MFFLDKELPPALYVQKMNVLPCLQITYRFSFIYLLIYFDHQCSSITLYVFYMIHCCRKEGQDTQDELQRRNLRDELEDRERRHFSSKGQCQSSPKSIWIQYMHQTKFWATVPNPAYMISIVDTNLLYILQRIENVGREGIFFQKVNFYVVCIRTS